MKYTYVLLISAIIPSIISGTNIKRSSSSIKTALADWIYHGTTIITIPDNHDISIKLTNQNNTLNINNQKKERKKNRAKNNTYKRY